MSRAKEVLPLLDYEERRLPSVEVDRSAALRSLLADSSEIYLKKMAANDTQWADGKAKQNGPYIPAPDRDSGFFKPLRTVDLPGGEPKREVYFAIGWPTQPKHADMAHLVNYTSKGEETHLTGLPRDEFRERPPQSLLLIGRRRGTYTGLVVPSDSPDAEYVEDYFGLGPRFFSGIFNPDLHRKAHEQEVQKFIDEARLAFREGTLDFFRTKHAIPHPKDLAEWARMAYAAQHQIRKFDPYRLDAPGDVLQEISRVVEHEMYRRYERKFMAVDTACEIAQGCRGDEAAFFASFLAKQGILIERHLSLAQSRKARGGSSFENHVEHFLDAGDVRYNPQKVFEGTQHDFVLPDGIAFATPGTVAAVISLKTTARERWRQVISERASGRPVYFGTLDGRLTEETIETLARADVRLVVPETMKTKGRENTTCYAENPNVMSFRDMFEEIRRRGWVKE